jgi:cyclophilin family peptidyl-prolyl cis-trans isomerase
MNPRNIEQIILLFLVCAALVAGLTWFVASKNKAPELLLDESAKDIKLEAPLSPEALKTDNQPTKNTMNPKAVFTTNKGMFELELYQDQMPITVGNFIKLAEEGFYNTTKFHRVIDGFMIQGGDPNSKGADSSLYGQGGPGYTIQDEFVAAPHLSNTRGTISMANTGQPNSGGSQFFINTENNIGLDFDKDPAASKHPVFGHVVSGMDVVDAIETTETGPRDLPVEPVVIEKVAILKAGG